jgi:hypothetical protein
MSRLLEHIIKRVLFEDTPIAKWLPKEKETTVQLYNTTSVAAAQSFGAVSAFDILLKMKMRGKSKKNVARVYQVINLTLSRVFIDNSYIQPYTTKDYVFIVSNPTSAEEQYVTVWVVPKNKLFSDEFVPENWPKPDDVKNNPNILTDNQINQIVSDYEEIYPSTRPTWWEDFKSSEDKRNFKIPNSTNSNDHALYRIYVIVKRDLPQKYGKKEFEDVPVTYPFIEKIGQAPITTYSKIIQQNPNLSKNENFIKLQANTKNIITVDTQRQRSKDEKPNWKKGWPSNIPPKDRWFYFPKLDSKFIYRFGGGDVGSDVTPSIIQVVQLKNYNKYTEDIENLLTYIPSDRIDDNIIKAMKNKIKRLS